MKKLRSTQIVMFIYLVILSSCIEPSPKKKPTVRTTPDAPVTSSAANVAGEWDFLSASNYIYDTTKIEVTSGVAKLKATSELYTAPTDFNSGTFTRTLTSSGLLTLDPVASADTDLTNSWAPKNNKLVAYWKMEEALWNGTANEVSDSIGIHHGVRQGDATTTNLSKVGDRAGTFDGAGDCISVADHDKLDGFGQITIASWIFSDDYSTTSNAIVRKDGSYTFYFVAAADGEPQGLQLYIWGASDPRIGYAFTNFSNSTWYHVAATFSGTNISLYVNGLQVASQPSTGTIPATANSLGIGAGTGCFSTFWNGQIDETSIWNTSLTSDEIFSIYQTQKQKFSGSFESAVISKTGIESWPNLKWKTSLPFFKELPGEAGKETKSDYSSLVNQTGNSGDGQLSEGLEALWHFNERVANSVIAGGQDFEDFSGKDRHAISTLVSGVTHGLEGVFDKAINLDGTANSLVNFPTADLPIGTESRSMFAWIKTSTATKTGAAIPFEVHNIINYGFQTWNQVYQLGLCTSSGTSCAGAGSDGHLAFNIYGTSLTSSFAVNDGKWHYVGVVSTGTSHTLYIDGVADTTKVMATQNTTLNTGSISINATAGWAVAFDGQIDEAAIWKRPLHASEVLQLYRRGINRVKFQVKNCDDAACDTETWTGPDGTNKTFFSELYNCSDLGTSNLCAGNVLASAPNIDLTRHTLTVASKPYFKYKAFLESDDEADSCSAAPCMPSVSKVGPASAGFYGGQTTSIRNVTPLSFTKLNSFAEEASSGCGLTHQLSLDGSNFFYYNGTSWQLAPTGTALANSANEITHNLNTFIVGAGTKDIYWKTFFNEGTPISCELDKIRITYE
jgi:hypothetical protein